MYDIRLDIMTTYYIYEFDLFLTVNYVNVILIIRMDSFRAVLSQ